jgi:hypothetical protein
MTQQQPELWYCRDCETFRALDGEEVFKYDAPERHRPARVTLNW